jgi:mitochondrial fission protein ELM1
MSPAPGSRVCWRFVDGKPGHDNQSRGLAQALAEHTPLVLHTLGVVPGRNLPGCWLGRVPDAWRDLPAPDLIIGAGHRTHWGLLAARRARGGRCIVLMKPSLPRRWFDLCLIPAHDAVPEGSHVLLTQGVLNVIRPGRSHSPERGLILLGGPSAHFGWSDAAVVEQIRVLLGQPQPRAWILGTSRRTPVATEQRLRELAGAAVSIVPWQDTDRDWLPAQLAQAGVVWVTEDSVSMVYEALSSGAAVGILELPGRRDTRVSRGVAQLLRRGDAVTFSRWRPGTALPLPATPFNEATRCARWIEEHWWQDA